MTSEPLWLILVENRMSNDQSNDSFFVFEQASESKIIRGPNADQIGIPRKQDNMALKGQTLDQQEDPCVPIYKPFMIY